ncbi:chemotaxis protein CheB [Roseivivax isoporae LMG 25204]|uniref:histidine kinase n=1 Tax=Roseivivax isoporae LMG 25204 TaxID=1449351 RepID=X7FAS8_9RHOB|nr:chemotaxis protein CheB [Roseivivax isoporae LMG 25204]
MCIVGIGASAGGLEAIREMLQSAQADAPMAYVVVQHLDPNHESLLAELLGRHTDLRVMQVSGGEKIVAGTVYIIPPGHGLSVQGGVLHLTEFAQPRGLRRPIDDFFESLAQDQGPAAACVILSGTGADGSAGLRAIKEHGGLCIVQDPDTAKYDGMPTSAQATGLVDFVRSPDRIIESIRHFHAHTMLGSEDTKLARTVEDAIADICSVVRMTVGHDFAGYKRSTLVRRVQRRIQVLDLGDATAYLSHIRADPDECEALFRDLLINVTRFFRDSEHFAALREHVVRPLVANTGRSEDIRVWVPGCSSGEEAYSIAMLFAHEARLQKRKVTAQVFATDIDERMLRVAREGLYPHAALADIPEEMRDLYTVARDGQFQVSAKIRDMIRFSVHSVVRDPPFSNIDLLSCRNLLIYFGDQLQASALPIFHYAVRPRGVLFLGPSETVGRYDHMFAPIDANARIFRRNDGRPEYPLHLRGQAHAGGGRRRTERQSEETAGFDWKETDVAQRILAAHAPPTLQVAPTGEILYATGKLGKYLELSPGLGERQYAAALARPGARDAVSAIIRRVAERQKRSVARDLRAQSEFGSQSFDLVADPLGDGTILLVFRERAAFQPQDEDEYDELDRSDSHVQSLEEELRTTRARLHTTVEELETANEELKSSNEEMMSMNEELQSTNEELSTVNDELKSKVDELSVANADLSNLFASTALPLVVVDAGLRIRNYTGAIQALYPIRAGDRGRPLGEMTSALRQWQEVLDTVDEVIRTGEVRQMRVDDRGAERFWSLAITPYRTRDGRLDGATLIFSELTEALRLEEALAHEGERLRLALDVAELGVWEYDARDRALRFDEMGRKLIGNDAPLTGLREVLRRVAPEDRGAVEDALRMRGLEGDAIDVTFALGDGAGRPGRSLRVVGRRVTSGPLTQGTSRVLGVVFDITAEREARRIRETVLSEMNHRVKNMFSIISGMVRIAGRSASSIEDLVGRVEERVNALARSHDLTQRTPDQGDLTLDDAVRASLAPHAGHADIAIGGPRVPAGSQDLTALSLLMHEWATNAAKYGVLGPIRGRLEVRWTQLDADRVELVWREVYDTPQELEQGPSGFGTTLVQLSAAQLDGRVDTETDATERRTVLVYTPRA